MNSDVADAPAFKIGAAGQLQRRLPTGEYEAYNPNAFRARLDADEPPPAPSPAPPPPPEEPAMPPRSHLTDEQKRMLVAEFKATPRNRRFQFSKDKGISLPSLYKWARKTPTVAPSARKPIELAAEVSPTRRDLVLLIGVVDAVRTALEKLPRDVARELVTHLAETYR